MKRAILITILAAAAYIMCASSSLAAGEPEFNEGFNAFANDLSGVPTPPPDPRGAPVVPRSRAIRR